MAARRKPQLETTALKPQSMPKKTKSRAKAAPKKSTPKPPIFPGLQSSTQRSNNDDNTRSSPPRAPDRQQASPTEAEVGDHSDNEATDTKAQEDQDPDSDKESIQSWENEITRWKPGQRPPLKHHPYDMWNNRLNARWGKCGRRRTPEPGHCSEDEDSNNQQMNGPAKESPVPRLRGGWLEEQPGSDAEDVGSDSDIEDVEMLSSQADSLATSENSSAFEDVQTVRLLVD